MKGELALNKAGQGGLIKLTHRPVLHVVWRDPEDGRLRICRSNMLKTTQGTVEHEWEVIPGKVNDLSNYRSIVEDLGFTPCDHCDSFSRLV